MDIQLRKAFAKVVPIDKCLYSGGGGYLFTVKGSPNRVAKFVSPIPCGWSDKKQVVKSIRYCANTKSPSLVKIYKHGILKVKTDYSEYRNGILTKVPREERWVYYVMEKLQPMPQDEISDIIRIVYDYYSRKKKISPPSFVSKQLRSFLAHANKLKLYHYDVHEGNIMQDKRGNFKFIDIESFGSK